MMDIRIKMSEGERGKNKKLQLRKRSLPPLKAFKISELSSGYGSSCIDLDFRENKLKFVRCISEKVLKLEKNQLSCNFIGFDSVEMADCLGSSKGATPTFRRISNRDEDKRCEDKKNFFLPDIGKGIIKVNSRIMGGQGGDKGIFGQRIVKRIKVLQHKFPKDMF